MHSFRPRNNIRNILTFLAIVIGSSSSFTYIYAQNTPTPPATPTSPTVLGASSANIDELKRKIEEQSKNIETLNKEIQQYAELKDKTTKEAQTLSALIKELDTNAKRLDTDIRKTRSQIEKANLEIDTIDIGIKTSEEKVDGFKVALADSLIEMARNEDIGLIPTILAKRDFSDVLMEINNRMLLNDRIQEEVNNLRKEKQELETNKVSKEKKKTELSEFQSELNDKKKVVEVNKNERAKVLTETKKQESTYQQLLAEKQAAKAAFEKDLFNYESQLKYTLDPSSIPRSGTAVFSWPLDSIKITQNFGKTVAAKRLYTSGSHNGMDFGAPVGTKVKAMLGGVVEGTGDTDLTCPRASFGRWVFIRYPNGLSSIYAHLSVISVKEGDKVTTGQTIGYSGNTGYSTGPHLHISVYASDAVKVENRASVSCNGKIYRMPIAPVDAYLDPATYLPKS